MKRKKKYLLAPLYDKGKKNKSVNRHSKKSYIINFFPYLINKPTIMKNVYLNKMCIKKIC